MKINLKKLNQAIKKLPKEDIEALTKTVSKFDISKKRLKEFSKGNFTFIENNPNYEWESIIRTLTKIILPIGLLLGLKKSYFKILQYNSNIKHQKSKYQLLAVLGMITVLTSSICRIVRIKKYYDELEIEDSIPNKMIRLEVNTYRNLWEDVSSIRPIDFFKHIINFLIKRFILDLNFYGKTFYESSLYRTCLLTGLCSMFAAFIISGLF